MMNTDLSISNITFDDIYENINVLDALTPDYYKTTYPVKMKKACRKHKVFIRSTASKIIDKVKKLDAKTVVFLYPAERFPNLCEKIYREFNILTFSNIFRKSEVEKKYEIKVLSNNSIQNGIFKTYNTRNMQYAKMALKSLVRILENNKVELIIIGDDWTFFERMCAVAGKIMDVPVVSFQHGIIHKDSMAIQQPGKVSSYFWCWSDYVKDSYEALFNPSKGFVRVVGYPHKLLSDYDFVNKNRVLFMSTPYYEDDHSKYAGFMNLIRKTIGICDELKFEFVIRLHPRDKVELFKEEFKDIHNLIISKGRNLYDEIKEAGIIIGDTSSTLLEANLLHRRSIQILWNEDVEQFSKNELYDSLIKVHNREDEIKNAIVVNIGQFFEDEDLYYHTGDPRVFDKEILDRVKETVKTRI